MLFRAKFLGILAALAICLFSCVTERTATEYMDKHPKALAFICGLKFPPKTDYIKGDTIHTETIVTIKGDSIECPPYIPGKVYIPVKVKCPDITYKIDSVFIHDTAMVENTARVEHLSFTISDLSKENEELEDKKEKLTNVLIILSALLLGAIYLVVKR